MGALRCLGYADRSETTLLGGAGLLGDELPLPA